MSIDLPLASALFLTGSLALYVMLDGFDLGVGALLLLEADEQHRDRMIDAIAPTWDGNETWLVMAGITLFACFPTAYSVLLPAFYLPLIFMLLSLGLRGVTFEFRSQTVKARPRWDVAFAGGSIIAGFAQGVIIGGLILGVATEQGEFVGGSFDWFNPVSLLFGFVSTTGYTVLGAGWLHLKGDSKTREFAKKRLCWITPVFLLFSIATCGAAYAQQSQIDRAWRDHSVVFITLGSIFFLIALALALRAHYAKFSFDGEPFICGVFMFATGLIGLVLTFWPYIVPFRITIRDAASPSTSQVMLLSGALLIVPVVIGYSFFSHWVFRGKTPEGGWGE